MGRAWFCGGRLWSTGEPKSWRCRGRDLTDCHPASWHPCVNVVRVSMVCLPSLAARS